MGSLGPNEWEVYTDGYKIGTETGFTALNRRFLLGVWTVNSPQSHIVRVYDAGHGKSGVFHSAEWHDGDWSSDGIRESGRGSGCFSRDRFVALNPSRINSVPLGTPPPPVVWCGS
ncbi:hypothetical protein TNCV_97751 [Trichonephila clavipes]|nr:hypothetical protein TNCV_97751 [Trichonephila clavipes]